ncbi:MAG TPA: acyl-CoA dehydrogenase family protein [Alphaproteobacteria bacterium]|nr:acyl-CoA dehydrogenase family protein [Alphaproteobacteria bacterium]
MRIETAEPFALPPAAKAWKERVRPLSAELKRHEIEAELAAGALPKEIVARHRESAIALGLSHMDVPLSHGGLELPWLVQAAVWEELGEVTNGLAWCFSEPQRWMFSACSAEQIERWIRPLASGQRTEAYAITEEESGSDLDGIRTTARREGDAYVLDGEKWFLTGANKADFFFLEARLAGGENSGAHVLFFLDKEASGLSLVRTPAFSHSFASHHPIYRLEDVRVPASNLIGREGEGLGFTYEWFRRERIMIAARCCGAARRLIEEAQAFAAQRMVSGQPIAAYQAIQFMLADSAAELQAARLLTYEAAAAEDRGLDRRIVHARASMAKLYASEMAGRVADRAVQIFGGRGYMRENVAERFYRELRVERIWEGTSEIQRLIIASSLMKRGLAAMLD